MSCKFSQANEVMDNILSKLDNIDKHISQSKTEIYRRQAVILNIAMNQIAMHGSGGEAYTKEFTNYVNGIARKALQDVEEIRNGQKKSAQEGPI